jgi:AmiR/NasT family two-component response regulator
VEIRLHGTTAECLRAVELLYRLEPDLTVIAASLPYHDQDESGQAQVYVQAGLNQQDAAP